MNVIRLLNSSDLDDRHHLSEILSDYRRSEAEKTNQVYNANYLALFSDWIMSRFKVCHTDDFAVYGNFYNDELIQIMIGYKFETGWGYDYPKNGTPYWYVGLAYFKDRAWRYPGVELINLGLCLGAHFEKQGYYKFYTVKKMPGKIQNYEQLRRYIDSEAFKKTYQVVRYNVNVEKIFRSTDDIKNFRFASWSVLLPRSISRPVMLLEFTLDPTIDINSIVANSLLN